MLQNILSWLAKVKKILMIKNKLLFLLLLFLPLCLAAQGNIIKGKVVSVKGPVSEVLVVNIYGEREAKTDEEGFFTLFAREGDTIIVTHPVIDDVKLPVTKDYFKSVNIINVQINEQYEMEEVVIEYDRSLTPEGLGLVPEGQRILTPMERKLYTAGDFKPIHLLAILGGGMPLDPVFNAINGRTKMLKKAVAAEQKEMGVGELIFMFTEQEIADEYNIPNEHVRGFLYFCIEDNDCTSALNSGNEELLKFHMSRLAVKYIDLIKDNTDED